MPLRQGRAALVHEQLEARFLLIGGRVGVALEILVERRRRRDQRRLEGLARLGEIIEGHRRRIARERLLEHLDIFGHRRHRLDDVLGRRVHFDAGPDGTLGLGLEVGSASIPELGDVEYGAIDRRRAARALRPAMAHRSRTGVDAAGAEIVAGIAADDLARRHPGIEERQKASCAAFISASSANAEPAATTPPIRLRMSTPSFSTTLHSAPLDSGLGQRS